MMMGLIQLLTKSDTLLESAKDLAQALITANMVSSEEEALTQAIVLITGLKKILYKKAKRGQSRIPNGYT